MQDDKFLKRMQITLVTLLILSVAACILASCKTTKQLQTEYVNKYVHDSVYIEKIDTIIKVREHRDSILLHDSVFVSIWQSADTVYKIKEIYKYRDRISLKHDTITATKVDIQYKERTDTAYIEKKSVQTEYVKRNLSWWQRLIVWFGAISIAAAALLTYFNFRK